jgi:phosphate transport system ATP-binding protein
MKVFSSARSGGASAASESPTAKIPVVEPPAAQPARLETYGVCAWFSGRLVLESVSLTMEPSQVTALIGPSGCGKSTYLRILNRMHELIPGAQLAGRVELDGVDIYGGTLRATESRKNIGMVFQKPNPFPAMTIEENVLAGLKFSRVRLPSNQRRALVEEMLAKAGLWNEVKNRLGELGGSLSGGQQQRLCIARALAVRPRILLMDEPCSALDPTSTNRIEETIRDIADEVTVIIVTHNMQQAQRVSDKCAFFLAAEGTPGRVVEFAETEVMFSNPSDPRTADYVHGRFG